MVKNASLSLKKVDVYRFLVLFFMVDALRLFQFLVLGPPFGYSPVRLV